MAFSFSGNDETNPTLQKVSDPSIKEASNKKGGRGYMGGSVQWCKDRYFVQVYWEGDRLKIWRYKDEPLYDKRTAEKLLNKIRGEIDDKIFNPKAYLPAFPLAMSVYAVEWVDRIDVRPSTRYVYKSWVRRYIVPFWKDRDIRKIRNRDLVEFDAWIPEGVRFNVMTCLKSMMRYAWRNEDIEKVPPFPKISAPDTGLIEYLTLEQQELILSFIPERHQPIFRFGMEYGLRVNEVRALMWDCISDKVEIRRGFSRGVLMETTKTSKVRTFNLTPNARRILDSIKTTTSTLVFVNDHLRRYSEVHLWELWKDACEKAGIHINLYNAFRHSLGCQLLDNDVPMDKIQKILGHTRPEMTKRYAGRSVASLTEPLVQRTAMVIDLKSIGAENKVNKVK